MILPSVKELEEKYSRNIVRLVGYDRLMSTRGLGDFEIYDWFPYTQRFPARLLRKLFKRKELLDSKTLLDSFMGSGNALVASSEFEKKGYGVDKSPLFWFITKVKTTKYSHRDFRRAINAVKQADDKPEYLEIPALSSFRRLFTRKQLRKLLAVQEAASNLDNRARDLLLFGLCSELLSFSRAKRYGKGLHTKNRIKPLKATKVIIKKLKRMEESCKEFHKNQISRSDPVVLLGDARELDKTTNPCTTKEQNPQIPFGEIDVVLTSPPYCNSSDYIEMYKLEHWFLGYVKTYEEFQKLSHSTIRSHTSFSNRSIKWKNSVVEDICVRLEDDDLWNPKIPTMIRGYFSDLYMSVQQIKSALRSNGTALIVVGNSSYRKIVIPTDLLVVQIATELGFEVKEIDIVRKLPTSGQQLGSLGTDSKRLLRESIVVLSS